MILDKKAQYPIACYEAKTGKFKPEDTQKHRDRAASIGCPEAKTICTNEDNQGAISHKTIVEHAIRNIGKHIATSNPHIKPKSNTRHLEKNPQKYLP